MVTQLAYRLSDIRSMQIPQSIIHRSPALVEAEQSEKILIRIAARMETQQWKDLASSSAVLFTIGVILLILLVLFISQ